MRCALFLVLLASGCSSCGGGEPVPFGLDREDTAEPPAGDESDAPTMASGLPEGRALAAGTRQVRVEGAPIDVGAEVRAVWAHDVDGDGDRDAVLLAGPADDEPPGRPVRVLYATREGAAFGAARELAAAPAAPEGCALVDASLDPRGPWLVAQAAVRCEDGATTHEYVVLSTAPTVRAQERLALLPSDEPGAARLLFDADDVNEDGRDDLTIQFARTLHDREDRILLRWLQTTSGLVREAGEPAATLDARSLEALRLLPRDPDAALEGSRAVLRLHRALCREPGEARVRVGGQPGLECGESAGAGRAITTALRAHAARGEALAALDAYEAMNAPGQLINEERRVYARRALASLPGTAGVTAQPGPDLSGSEVSVPPDRAFTLSALGFLDEEQVLVRSTRPRRWRVGAGLEPADPRAADVRVMDPQERFAVAALESRCGAVRLAIVDASAGSVPVSTPPLWGDGEGCDEPWREDGLGWTLLGWAPQGIVAARGSELRVVPLDVAARPSGPPRTLEADTPPPAPLPAGQATPDGRYHVELRGPAVLVHGGGEAPALWWPEGWGEAEGEVAHAAISPSGQRVAVVRGGRLMLLERARD